MTIRVNEQDYYDDRGNLVLTRRVGEAVDVGPVTFTIVEVRTSNRVRVSIEAPRSMRIDRVDDPI